MESLAQIQAKLKNIMLTSNIESPELDALCLLLSNSIYQNQVNVTSAAIEMSPTKCIQLNSAIVHARDKDYSVFRGKNPHFIIKNAYVTKFHDMSKYAVFAETNNYKLVLANDYSGSNVLTGNAISNLEVILTKDVITESFTAEGLYSHTLSGTGISEDISLFSSNGTSTSDWSKIDLVRSITDIGLIEANEDSTKVAAITDTDYSVTLYNVTKFKSDYAYICKYLPLINNDIGDIAELMSKFKSFNGFALKPVKKMVPDPEYPDDRSKDKEVKVVELDYLIADDTGKGIEGNSNSYVSPRETNKDNIYLNSIYAFNTIHKISTENDIEYIFKSYKDFSQRATGIKCVFSGKDGKTTANLFYVPNNIDSTKEYREITESEKNIFISYVQKSFYLEDNLIFTYKNINEVDGMSASQIINGITEPGISGVIKVHATKNVLGEVTNVANYYVKSSYKSKDGDEFYPAQWLAVMQKIDGVNYIEIDGDLSLILSKKKYKDDGETSYIGKYINDYIIDNAGEKGQFTITLIEE